MAFILRSTQLLLLVTTCSCTPHFVQSHKCHGMSRCSHTGRFRSHGGCTKCGVHEQVVTNSTIMRGHDDVFQELPDIIHVRSLINNYRFVGDIFLIPLRDQHSLRIRVPQDIGRARRSNIFDVSRQNW
ncbi:hypothetical protein DFH29DRAFT_577281 [Suillus ampliporus]|nr:hypothetical protein DFH29DRAFT_577281 [Suillus ampliporus]